MSSKDLAKLLFEKSVEMQKSQESGRGLEYHTWRSLDVHAVDRYIAMAELAIKLLK